MTNSEVPHSPQSTMMSPQALAGLKVVECATVIAAPMCGRLLADFGAEVIHIEHPRHGDHLRQFGVTVDDVNPWFTYYNRNKKLVTLDVSQDDGRTLLIEMIRDADVFIENFRPGRLEAWGIEPEHLLEINPRLIIVRLTGYGQTGPYSHQPGFGTIIEAFGGFAAMTGEPDGPPILPTFALADSLAGMNAALAIMFALYNRDTVGSGRGQVIDVSIFESLFTSLGPNALYHELTGKIPARTGNRIGTTAPRNVYRTSDDAWIAIAGSTQSTAERLFRRIGDARLNDPKFATNKARLENVDELDEIVGGWMRQHTRAELVDILREAEVPVGPVLDIADLRQDPQVIARGMVVNAPHATKGHVPMEGVFPRMSATPGGVRSTPGTAGTDNAEIYEERLGVSRERLQQLRRKGVL